MSLEAYSVAVRLRLVNEVSTGLSAMALQFAATDKHAAALQKRLTAIKTQALAGAALFGTGAVMAAPIIFAISKAAELQKQLIAVQIATRGTTGEMINMRRGIEGIASQTIFSNIDVAKMAKLVATGTGLGAGDVSKLLPAYAKFADVQMLMKGTSYDASVKDAIRLAHTAQHYDPTSLGKYLDLLTKASLIVPGSLGEVGQALKYSQGMGKTALGINDESMVLLTSLLNRLGFAGSRGGTNLIAAMTRTIPGIFGSGLLTGKSAVALNNMGMVDSSGHSKFFTNGKFDAFKWMGGLSGYVQKEFASHPEALARQDIMKNFQHAFGVQGARVASLLADPKALEQLRKIGEAFAGYGGVDAMQKKFADESVEQKMINAKTNFISAMTEIGYTLLPLAATGLTRLNIGLQGMITWITDNPGKVKVMTVAFTLLSASLMFGGIVNLAAAGFKGIGLALSILSVGGAGGTLGIITRGAIGLVAALTGPAGLMIAVGAIGLGIGAFIGTIINHGINGLVSWMTGGKEDSVGGWVYDLTHNDLADKYETDKHDKLYAKNHPDTVATKSGKPVHATINFIMDGHTIASKVVKHMERGMSQPQGGVTFADSMMSMPSPANPF
jgi:hypothetical protein